MSRALPVHPRHGRRVAAVLASAALALSACSNAPMDRAATINGQVISESELQEATAQFNEVAGQPVSPGQVLGVLTQLPALEPLVAGSTSEIPDADLEREVRAAGVEDPNPLLLEYVRGLVYLQAVGGQLPPEQLADLDVEVNPRYGSWDPERAAVVPQLPDWIATDEVDS